MPAEKNIHENADHAKPVPRDETISSVSEKKVDAPNESKNSNTLQPIPIVVPPNETTNANQHAHHRKKWHDYLFDFLMLFFAITLGFFVDNRREYYLEGEREKVYALSLYDDLAIDTAVIQRTYDEKLWAHKKLDSLSGILSLPNLAPYNEIIYYLERFITQTDVFTSRDVTYQQLRSSGNFRYIENISLYKKIADYYNLYDRYLQLAESSFGNLQALTEMEATLFNGKDLASLNNKSAETFYDLFNRPEKKFAAINADVQALNFLAIKAANATYSIMASERFLAWLKMYAADLMIDLKEEYHLK